MILGMLHAKEMGINLGPLGLWLVLPLNFAYNFFILHVGKTQMFGYRVKHLNQNS